LDAGRRRKKIAGGGGPGEESSSKQQTYEKEGETAYNNAYNHLQDLRDQKKIDDKTFDQAIKELSNAFYTNKDQGWTAEIKPDEKYK
jgi:hypothetical protein